MNYDQRIAHIRNWVTDMISRYDRPTHLTHDKAAAEVRDMAEDLNSELPANLKIDQLSATLERTAQQIRKRQRTRTWPTIQMVISCARECLPGEVLLEAAPSAPSSRDGRYSLVHASRMIKAGKPVAESYISGRGRIELLKANLVTEEDLAQYKPPGWIFIPPIDPVIDEPIVLEGPTEWKDPLDAIDKVTW